MGVSQSTLRRLPLYLSYLKRLPSGSSMISATAIAAALDLGEVQVRKDLAGISGGGKPKTGYMTSSLIDSLESYLGYKNKIQAVLVGAGKLGSALLSYRGFDDYGLNILAAFDTNPERQGAAGNRKPVYSLGMFEEFCRDRQIRIGIITVPADSAQRICDLMCSGGIRAIWNFAPIHLNAGNDILIQNENMAASLALLSNHLKERSVN